MRCRYKEHAYYCSECYIDVDVYPAYRSDVSRCKGRRRKYKPTSEVQNKLNERNKASKLIRLVNTNFTSNDIRLDLTYHPSNHPESADQAKRDFRNFILRVKRFRKRKGLPDVKYIAVIECGKSGNKFHHHMIISGDMTINEYTKLWNRGYTGAKALVFNERGVEDLVNYLLKNPVVGSKNGASYSASRNLKKPIEKRHTGRLSRRAIEFMAGYIDTSPLEKLYQGYELVDMTPYYNDVNGGYYFHCKFYKPPKNHRKQNSTQAG